MAEHYHQRMEEEESGSEQQQAPDTYIALLNGVPIELVRTATYISRSCKSVYL